MKSKRQISDEDGSRGMVMEGCGRWELRNEEDGRWREAHSRNTVEKEVRSRRTGAK